MMEELEKKFADRDYPFKALDRYVMCFGHVVELCSKRVVSADGADGGDPSSSDDGSHATTTQSAPTTIAQARAVV